MTPRLIQLVVVTVWLLGTTVLSHMAIVTLLSDRQSALTPRARRQFLVCVGATTLLTVACATILIWAGTRALETCHAD